jgi:radical SAM superfamily enzyme YgiQ (UPF0313 family)
MRVLLVGIYDTNAVSLAPRLLAAHAARGDYGESVKFLTREFSIFKDEPEDIARAINAEGADIVGLSAYVWNIALIRAVLPLLTGRIILGGPQVTGVETKLLAENPALDMVVTGEGEQVLVDLIQALCGRGELAAVAGLTTREFRNAPAAQPVDLALIPPFYGDIFRDHPDLGWIAFQTSRGCPFGCRYCCWGSSRAMRYHPLEQVLAELEVILAQPSITSIYFCDSDLLLNKPRTKIILERVIASERNVDVRFEFNAEHLDDEVLGYLERMTSKEVNFGLQTTNPAALQAIGRRFDPRRFKENFDKASARFGDRITIDLIYGLPGDDYAGYKASMEFVLTLGRIGRVLTNPLLVLPGSEFFKERERYGIELGGRDGFAVRRTGTFSAADMDLARALSFWVAVVFLNTKLRDAVTQAAKARGWAVTDTLLAFADILPPELKPARYPDMVPSERENFRQRNAALARVIAGYDHLVACFVEAFQDGKTGDLADHSLAYSDQYVKIKRFIASDGA